MMTFLLLTPASTKWLGCRKDRKSRRNRLCRFVTFIVQSYFVLLVISDIQWIGGAVVLKVMDQKTLVKRRWSYKVRITVYINKLCIYINTWRVCQTRVHKSLIGNLARHSFSLFDRNKTQPQTSKTSGSTASLSLAEQWTITEIRRQSDSVLTPCSQRCPSAIKFKIRLECASAWIDQTSF